MSFELSQSPPAGALEAGAAQRLDTHQLIAPVQSQAQTIASLQHQIEWFKRQLFGRTSERFAPLPDALQMHLGEVLGELPASPQDEPGRTVPAHKRRKPRSDFQDGASAPFFDESKVPVHTIAVPHPETLGLRSEQFEVIAEKANRVITMDEMPIKAGMAGRGKMKSTYSWPTYGERDETCFPHFESRCHEHVQQVFGLKPRAGAVLLSDGYAAYAAYAAYARRTGIANAQCWAHSRRAFFEAQRAEPEAAAQTLRQIGVLYEVEDAIGKAKLNGAAKRAHCLTHSKPLVECFFAWVHAQFERQGLLPSNPLTKALTDVRERRAGLEIFLNDAKVAVDTNHIERALRPIPMGRRSWLFCWTEVGARHAGIVQSLIATCRLHDIDPYVYLVDVLQRVGQHPAARVHELTPRLWKQHFADNPLRSDLHGALA